MSKSSKSSSSNSSSGNSSGITFLNTKESCRSHCCPSGTMLAFLFRSIYIFRVSPSPSKLVSYSLFRLLVILVLVIVLVIVLVLVVVILIVIAVEDLKTQLPALQRAEQKLHLVYIGKLEP